MNMGSDTNSDVIQFHQKYSWVNEELFKKILRPNDVNSVTIRNFNRNLAVCNGENYSSVLFRVNVDYSVENDGIHSKVFLIKVRGNLKRSQDVFLKEIQIYDEILPQMEKIWELSGKPYKFAPRCHGTDLNVHDLTKSYLVLEDLTQYNYHNFDRKQGLNVEQLKYSLSAVAKWHAASARLIEDNNGSLDKFELFEKPHVHLGGSIHYRTLFEYATRHCKKMIRDRNYGLWKKLNDLRYVVFEQCCGGVDRDTSSGAFNVLNHGDLWCNNIMFKMSSDDKYPLLVDYQMSYYGSPVLDVSYLLFTSSSGDVTPQDFVNLFDHYCDKLIVALKDLKFDVNRIPTKEKLRKEMDKRGLYGAYYSLFTVPMRMLETDNTDNVIRYLKPDEEKFRYAVYSNEKTVDRLEKLLNYYDSQKWLDVKPEYQKLLEDRKKAEQESEKEKSKL